MSFWHTPENFFNLSNFLHSSIFYDAASIWQVLPRIGAYLSAKKWDSIDLSVYKGVIFENPGMISIGDGTTIEAGAYIKGPVIIGKNCEIRHGAYIRGNVLIGDACVIGHTTELKHSILFNGAKAAHFAFIGDSIIGNGVNIGAGVKCANLRFDNQPISIQYEGKKIATGLRKFGSIIGDSSQIGCNAVLGPGTIVGKSVFCYPTLYITGVIPDHARVKSMQKSLIAVESANQNLD